MSELAPSPAPANAMVIRSEAVAMEIGAIRQLVDGLDPEASAAWGVRCVARAAKLMLAGSGVANAALTLAEHLGGAPVYDLEQSVEWPSVRGLLIGTFEYLAKAGSSSMEAAAGDALQALARSSSEDDYNREIRHKADRTREALGVAHDRWLKHGAGNAALAAVAARGAWDFKWPLGLESVAATIDADTAAAFDDLELGARFAGVNIALGPALYQAGRLPLCLPLNGVVTPDYLQAIEHTSPEEHPFWMLTQLEAAVDHVRASLLEMQQPPRRPGDRPSVKRAIAFAWVDEMTIVRGGALRHLLSVSKPGLAHILDSLDAADALRSRPHSQGRLWTVSQTFGTKQRLRAMA